MRRGADYPRRLVTLAISHGESSSTSFGVFVLVIAAVGLNIRAGLGSVPPLLPAIVAEYRISNTQAGMLTSIAAIFIGLFAPAGHRLGARIGVERATAWCLGALSLAGFAHMLHRGPLMLFVTIAATGAAMGAASSMVPSLIAQNAERSRGFVMGVYTTGMALGIAFTAAIAVPVEKFFGTWRASLAVSGVFAAAATALWILVMVRGRPRAATCFLGLDRRLPWGSRTARLVAGYLSTQMILGYACMAWVAPFYVSLGLSAGESAGLLVFFQSVQLISMVGLPSMTDRMNDRRPVLAFAALSTSTGIAMLLLDPLTLALPAVALTGLGIGGGAALGLVLVMDCTRTASEGSRLMAMCLLVGNLLGAGGPLLLGVFKDTTDSYRPGLTVLLGLSLGTLVLIQRCHPGRVLRPGTNPARASDFAT